MSILLQSNLKWTGSQQRRGGNEEKWCHLLKLLWTKQNCSDEQWICSETPLMWRKALTTFWSVTLDRETKRETKWKRTEGSGVVGSSVVSRAALEHSLERAAVRGVKPVMRMQKSNSHWRHPNTWPDQYSRWWWPNVIIIIITQMMRPSSMLMSLGNLSD